MAQGFTRREIGRDGVRLSYLDDDAPGPVVVLLHGLAGAGDEFTATASAVGGRYRFILPDLRGHGASTRRPADLSRAAFTSDVAALISHVSPGRPVALAGQSRGDRPRSWSRPPARNSSGGWWCWKRTPRAAPMRRLSGATSVPGRFRSPRPPRRWSSSATTRCAVPGPPIWSRHRAVAWSPRFDADVMEAIMTGVAEPCWRQWQSVTAQATAVFAASSMFSPGEQPSSRPRAPGPGT